MTTIVQRGEENPWREERMIRSSNERDERCAREVAEALARGAKVYSRRAKRWLPKEEVEDE